MCFLMKNELYSRLKQTSLRIFFSRKTKKIYHPSLCFNNSIILETHIKNTLVNFESNYYQGKHSYRTVAKVAQNFAKTGINN